MRHFEAVGHRRNDETNARLRPLSQQLKRNAWFHWLGVGPAAEDETRPGASMKDNDARRQLPLKRGRQISERVEVTEEAPGPKSRLEDAAAGHDGQTMEPAVETAVELAVADTLPQHVKSAVEILVLAGAALRASDVRRRPRRRRTGAVLVIGRRSQRLRADDRRA